jgi:hypothetical protein
MSAWNRRSSTRLVDLPGSGDACTPSSQRMSRAMEDFIENYLLRRGYPLTEGNRERARKILALHPEPNPDLIGWSEPERTTLLDRRMGIGFR